MALKEILNIGNISIQVSFKIFNMNFI
jgi:hypothetical protein